MATEKQETKDFPIGDAVATVGLRCNGSMWVSVLSKNGAHFQCDFMGSFDMGPRAVGDFLYGPPQWVRTRLGVAAKEDQA